MSETQSAYEGVTPQPTPATRPRQAYDYVDRLRADLVKAQGAQLDATMALAGTQLKRDITIATCKWTYWKTHFATGNREDFATWNDEQLTTWAKLQPEVQAGEQQVLAAEKAVRQATNDLLCVHDDIDLAKAGVT